MNEERKTVWVTKWALTKGIQKEEVNISSEGYAVLKRSWGVIHQREWHLTEEAAKAKAEEMRVKKIAALKTQIENLERMKFV